MWMLFDYESVKRVVSDHETFSSAVPAPDNWFLLRSATPHKAARYISRAFTPRMVGNLEPRIRQLSRELLDKGSSTV